MARIDLDAPSGSHIDFRIDRGDELPVGIQLAWKLRTSIADGRLPSGQRLPSVRQLAERAGVNVNTVRAVYRRLEEQGLVVSEQGRGTFVADHAGDEPASDRIQKHELRRQIAELEAELVRHPRPPPGTGGTGPTGRVQGNVLSTAELKQVRDDLLSRLEELESARADVLRRLRELRDAEADWAREEGLRAVPEGQGRHSSSSLGSVRLRWIGGA